MMCKMCGDPRHEEKQCDVKVAIRCPVCGYGTYIHDSGVRACVNALCSWVAQTFEQKKCDICSQEKPDVRYADLLDKWICSDCMGVPEFSEG